MSLTLESQPCLCPSRSTRKHHEPTLQRFGQNHKLNVVVGGCFGTCLPREEQLRCSGWTDHAQAPSTASITHRRDHLRTNGPAVFAKSPTEVGRISRWNRFLTCTLIETENDKFVGCVGSMFEVTFHSHDHWRLPPSHQYQREVPSNDVITRPVQRRVN